MQSKRERRQARRSASSQPKPFKPNIEHRDVYTADVIDKVGSAIVTLGKAMENAEHWADYETMRHYQIVLEKFLSDENGEIGFSATYPNK